MAGALLLAAEVQPLLSKAGSIPALMEYDNHATEQSSLCVSERKNRAAPDWTKPCAATVSTS